MKISISNCKSLGLCSVGRSFENVDLGNWKKIWTSSFRVNEMCIQRIIMLANGFTKI